jgi:hypothetical protein
MDIYILRDGQETGPFSEETTQSLLKQGALVINDLAWQPGLPTWLPLIQVLYPAAVAGASDTPTPTPMPASFWTETPVPEAEPAKSEPATGKQKAFLTYVGTIFPPDLTKEKAALMMNEAMDDPALHDRVMSWTEDRLKLHPELFASEIQARKENRAQRFFELCRAEGAEHFTSVTKAHCQVLVGYLDVRFPNWDANETEGLWNYFFPAVAEKFPQLVNKPWRGKLHYPTGRKVAAELVQRGPVAHPGRRGFPVGALIRGMVFGLAILLMLYVGQQWVKDGGFRAATGSPTDPVAPLTSLPSASETASVAPVAPTPEPPSADSSAPAAGPPGGMADSSTSAPPTSNTSLFDSPPATTPSEPPAAAEAPAIAPKTFLTVTKPIGVPTRYGRAQLPVGTRLKIVLQQGLVVKALYAGEEVILPMSATDLGVSPPPLPVP